MKKIKSQEKNLLRRKMVNYSSAATAALAMSGHAEASIVNVDVTGWNLGLSGLNDFNSFNVDLNGDAVNDFEFVAGRTQSFFTIPYTFTTSTTYGSITSTTTFQTYTYASGSMYGRGQNGGELATAGGWLAKLGSGESVKNALDANANTFGSILSTYYNMFGGNTGDGFYPGVNDADTGFVGVSFSQNGDIHYGWLEVLVSRDANGAPESAEILSAAYEDVPGADILAGAVPEPGTLGLILLALGAGGVREMRKRRAK